MYVQPTFVTLNPLVMGKRLANLIVERIENNNNINNREIMFIPQLINGTSTRIL